MSLIEYDLFGNKYDKVEKAIERLKCFEPKDGYTLMFSGGKDSVVTKRLMEMSGCKFTSVFRPTTVDPPELVRFIIKNHPDVIIQKPKISMKQLIVKKHMPPTHQIRFCCEYLKEKDIIKHGNGKIIVTGVRWAESVNRKKNQGLVTVYGNKINQSTKDKLEEQSVGYSTPSTTKGAKANSIILNYDNADSRRAVEMCYRTAKTLVNPIIDWTDDEVWEFIHKYNVPYCELYDQGYKRIGCVGCPMATTEQRKKDLKRWNLIYKVYLSAFREMIAERERRGLDNSDPFDTPEHVMEWWLRDRKPSSKIDNQISFDGLDD